MVPSTYLHLPLPAKCAIDYLDAQGYGNRNIDKLDRYLDHYFKVYGQVCDQNTRFSCHHIAIRRFSLEGANLTGAITNSVIA